MPWRLNLWMRFFLPILAFLLFTGSPLCLAVEMTYEDAVDVLESDFDYDSRMWIFTNSTAMNSIVWYKNSEENYFTVSFLSDISKKYLFKNMNSAIWIDWTMTDSPGGFYNANIRDQPGHQVNSWNPAKKFENK